jgi:outer membrane biosynthesis protein TonB
MDLRKAAIYSGILHLIVFVLLTVGFKNPFEKTLVDEQPLLVEFVQISENRSAPIITPTPNEEPEEQKQDPAPEEKPAAKPEPRPEPKPEVRPEPKPEVKPEPKPEPKPQEPAPTPEPEPEADPIPEIKPKQKPEPEKKEPPKEQTKSEETVIKPKQKPTPPERQKAELTLEKNKAHEKSDKKDNKKPTKDFDDLLNEIEKTEKKSAGKSSSSSKKGAPAQSLGPVVTASEIDAIREKIRKCWIVPAGARGAKDLVVDIDMTIERDGTVKSADIVDKSRVAADPFYRAAAESARRAVLDPKCNPLPLSPEKYEQWKNLTMSFNPRDMY